MKKHSLRLILIELALYGLFVTAYFFLVLHFLEDWVASLHDNQRMVYALVTLGLITGQGIVLEMLTSAIINAIRIRLE